MDRIVPPKYVLRVLFTLQSRGYPAYLVGGCVRDMLLGVHPQDWDVCTGARPEEVMAVFPKTRPTGLRHGTVTVIDGSHAIEVTTFRSEGDYSDHRHPDAVRFVTDLTADLSRRDFTINAMALSAEGVLTDPFGGRADLKKGLVRCVGEPDRRFEEDALRMFRALRFAARLGFSLDPDTREAIRRNAALASALACERVREELEKLLLSKSPETLGELVDLGLLDPWLYHRPSPGLAYLRLSALPRTALARWCGLCWLLERDGAIASAEGFLGSLRLDSRSIRCCAGAIEILSAPMPAAPAEWKRCLRRHGVDAALCASQCADAFERRGHTRALKAVLASGECFSLRHLAVGGEDLLALGLRGKALGEMLDFLVDYVIDYPENNVRELLLNIAAHSEE